jgi:hypothetical protein
MAIISAGNDQTGDELSDEHTTTGTVFHTGSYALTGTLATDGHAITFAAASTNDPLVIIKNTTNDSGAAQLRFVKEKGAAGADGDDIGHIQFYGTDANQDQVHFASISAEVSESADGQEGGKLALGVASHDGEMVTALKIEDGANEDETVTTINAPALGMQTVTASGTLDLAYSFFSIANGGGSTLAATLPDASYPGKLVVVTSLSAGGACTVEYGIPSGTTITQTLTNGYAGLILISVGAAGGFKWITLGDTS